MTTMHDRVLHDAYRAWMANSDPAGHLDDAAWERLAMNEAHDPERAALLGHVFACSECAVVWQSVLALTRYAETAGLIATQPASSVRRSPFVALAVAASLVLVVGAGVFVARQTNIDSSSVRSGNALVSIEGMMAAYDAHGVPSFAWTPVPGATHYRLQIFTEDGRPVWSGDVAGPPASWPVGTPQENGRYRWRVDGLSVDGRIARSRLTVMDIAR